MWTTYRPIEKIIALMAMGLGVFNIPQYIINYLDISYRIFGVEKDGGLLSVSKSLRISQAMGCCFSACELPHTHLIIYTTNIS
jgi:hypothetical protein